MGIVSSTKRILLIGNADSIYIRNYINEVLLPAGYAVVIFPIWKCEGANSAFFRDKGIVVYQDKHTLPITRHIPRLRMWARIWLNARSLYRLGPFSCVHNHYLSQRDLALGALVARRFHSCWVCSYWGSDLLRASSIEQRRMRYALSRCDAITMDMQQGEQIIRERYGDAIAQKFHLVYFGLNIYAVMDELRTRFSKAECKAHMGVDPERYTICVGYNASSAQRQLDVLHAIASMPPETLSRLAIILQLTYGENDADYTSRLIDFAQKMPCQTVVLREFMNEQESAFLRLSADLFIHAITTDSFSSSMTEYLYAGACLLRGDWLIYPSLQKAGIDGYSFHDFSELPAYLNRALSGRLPGLSPEQQAYLPRINGWPAAREKWLELYR